MLDRDSLSGLGQRLLYFRHQLGDAFLLLKNAIGELFGRVDEGNEFRPRDAVRLCSPVAPAIGRLNCRAEALAGDLGLFLPDVFRVVKNLRNKTQVSMGSPSRSPESPLSFRIMSRQDLTKLPSCWAVDWGCWILDV